MRDQLIIQREKLIEKLNKIQLTEVVARIQVSRSFQEQKSYMTVKKISAAFLILKIQVALKNPANSSSQEIYSFKGV